MSSFSRDYLDAYRAANGGRNPPDPMLGQKMTDADRAFNQQFAANQPKVTGISPMAVPKTQAAAAPAPSGWNEYTATQFANQNGVDLSSSGGIARGGVLDRAANANPALMARYKAAINSANTPLPTPTGGGIPIGVEPLHAWEKDALTKLANPGALGGGGMQQGQDMLKDFAANPQAFISRYTNPMASKYLDQAGQAFAGANAPVTGQEIQARMNPFQEQVIDTSLAQQSQAAQKAKAALLKNLGTRGAAGFGSTISGTQLGEMEAGNVRDAASLGANLRYQGFNDSTGQVNTERNRGIQVGQGFGNLGAQAQGVTTAAAQLGTGTAGALFDTGNVRTNQGYNTLDRMLNAGKYVRDYNQGLASGAEEEYMAAQNFPMTQANNVLNLLGGVQSGGTQYQDPYTRNNQFGNIASGISAAGKIIPQITPWLA
jgi:hypothetical protein